MTSPASPEIAAEMFATFDAMRQANLAQTAPALRRLALEASRPRPG